MRSTLKCDIIVLTRFLKCDGGANEKKDYLYFRGGFL